VFHPGWHASSRKPSFRYSVSHFPPVSNNSYRNENPAA
jgi:hypothetical protein